MVNLLSNALKFTNFGEIRLDITEITKFNDECELNFSVKDTGIGIPQDKTEAIFKPFIQAAKSTTRLYGGTGLGLAIAKGLINLLGGEITVSSVINKGSSFVFTIPFIPDYDYYKEDKKDE